MRIGFFDTGKIINLFKKDFLRTIIFFFYLVSGGTKALLFLYGIHVPGDITLLLGIVLCMIMGLHMMESYKNDSSLFLDFLNMSQKISIALFMVFTFWLLMTLVYTYSSSYGFWKAILWLTVFIAFYYPFVIRVNPKLLFTLLFVFSLVATLIYISKLDASISGADPGELDSGNFVASFYLLIGYLWGIVYLSLLYRKEFFWEGLLFEKHYMHIFALLIALFLLFTTAARGPLVFCVLLTCPLVAYWFYKRLIRGFEAWHVVMLFIGGAGVVVLVSIIALSLSGGDFDPQGGVLSRTLFRLSLLFSDDKGASVGARIGYIEKSIKFISDKYILGYGIGSFTVVTTGVDERGYPHNIILEVWFELGMVGLIVFVCFLLSCAFAIKNASLYGMIIFLYLMLNALKSSSLTDLRIMFGVLAVVTLYGGMNLTHSDKTEVISADKGG